MEVMFSSRKYKLSDYDEYKMSGTQLGMDVMPQSSYPQSPPGTSWLEK
jgi:hypothetical protein